jgi:hypothetical protein
MQVLKGTYRISLWDFIKLYSKNIKDYQYTETEAFDCIEMINNGVFQFLKIYVINGSLKSCCKLITIARDFMDNKIADRSGRYYDDYSEEERFYMAHISKFDYMEVISPDELKIKRLVDLIGFCE